MQTWTLARRIVTTFGTCAAVMTALVVVGLLGFARLQESHRASAGRAESALQVTEAAADGADLYGIIADAEVNLDLEKTQAVWVVARERALARLAQLAALAETADDRQLVARAR